MQPLVQGHTKSKSYQKIVTNNVNSPPCEWSINVSVFLVPVDGWVASPFSEEYVTRKVRIDLFIDLIEPSVRIYSSSQLGPSQENMSLERFRHTSMIMLYLY